MKTFYYDKNKKGKYEVRDTDTDHLHKTLDTADEAQSYIDYILISQ